jgi:hypothetical protein
MSQYADSDISRRQSFLHDLGKAAGPAYAIIAFSHDNEVYQFFSFFFFSKRGNDRFYVRFRFRDQDIFGAGGNTTVQGNITSIPAHYFYNKKPVMRIHGIPDLIYCFNCCIHCRVEANGYICTGHVLIDCTG